MKKKYSLFLSIILIISLLAVSAGTARADSAQAQKLSIVTTIFPEYDWVMNILGDQAAVAEVTMLLDNGVDLHSYQPTVDDIIKISTCDVFIYVGGESDEWVDSALAEATNRDMIVINLLEVLGDRAKEEEIVEGMEAEHEHDEHHDENLNHEHEEEAEYDEHVWLSLKNAVALCSVIADALGQADPAHAEEYQANTAAYTEMLSELDAQFEAAVEAASVKTVLFGDRFPFRYLTDDYNLRYYAAFVGCSAETEASFATIVFLANKADELELSAICQIESSNGSIARTIKENTHSKNQEILTFDSMQSTTSRDVANGASYLGIMEQNLETLKLALQ